MIKRISQRFQDMKALSTLMQAAEHHSRKRSEGDEPSAEHFVLAAIESQDGAARKVFAKLGLDASGFEDALRDQYKHSLSSMGIDIDDAALRIADDSLDSGSRSYKATESGTELLRNMSQQQSKRPFSGADVLRAIASIPTGPAHRAFIVMGTTAEEIALAAQEP